MTPTEKIAQVQIQALMEDRVRAVRAKDIDAVMLDIAPDIVTYDLIPPLRYEGAEALRQRLQEWFGSFDGPIDFQQRDLDIVASNDVAFCHSLNGVDGIAKDGEHIRMWFRATVCCRRIGGKWFIVHEHSSVPFDMATGQATMSASG